MNKERMTQIGMAIAFIGFELTLMIQDRQIRNLEKDVHYLKTMELDRTINDLVREAGRAHAEVLNERKNKKEH